MIISNKKLLMDFVQNHAQAVKPLNKWVEKVKTEHWQSHTDVKRTFGTADYVGNGRYVFNISGNNFRLIAVVLFVGEVLDVRFIGTHSAYSKIKDCSEL
ncbi:type II toxin-antitoxin system HigB family toxin [Bacteroides ihuae]|uniref:type II toxin-antitoxin system HigB family toxin n=1 Tax=Bacteroides ihuae TaxID=1852362 RepID=UPI0008D92324|nr:type II toxin-antitoxin system HigB family toxin [Bacteroides ihuae]